MNSQFPQVINLIAKALLSARIREPTLSSAECGEVTAHVNFSIPMAKAVGAQKIGPHLRPLKERCFAPWHSEYSGETLREVEDRSI